MNSGISQIRRAVMTLALPVTVSSLLQRAEGILDIFLVGGLGASSIAAVGIGQLLAFFLLPVGAGLSVGATVVIAQLWGARRLDDGREAAVHVLGLAILASLILMGLGLAFAPSVMQVLGASPEVIALAVPYVKIIFLVIPFTMLIQILSGILHGTGDTRTPMYCMIGVNILHVLLAYPLIYGRWDFPNLGVSGAAVAVGIAESAGVVFLLIRCRPLLTWPRRLRGDLLRAGWGIGAPVFGERMAQQIGVLVYSKLVLLYGTAAYAAHQVGLAIEAFSFLPGYGFAIAAATMVGQSIGAGKYTRAKLENWEANRLAAIVMAAMGVIFFFFPYALLRAFTDDSTVIELGTLYLKIVALLQIPLAVTMVLAGSLRGAGDTRYIMVATLVGMWGLRLPIAGIGALWLHLDLIFIWGAMAADWLVRMSLLLWRYRSERWRAIQVIAR
ncbi:MAG: MATE family efflux transporter [Nitrospirae bacterium]|nr:MATE family efflux transporter [Nitrospirota bacterium]